MKKYSDLCMTPTSLAAAVAPYTSKIIKNGLHLHLT